MSEYAKTEDQRDEAPAAKTEPRRRALAMPDGWLGILMLLVIASALGGVIALYWPWTNDGGVSEERVAALEAQVSQLASGHGGTAASGVFADLKRSVATLSTRLDTDEARLTAMEKAAPAATGSPQAGIPDTTTLHGQVDASAVELAQLNQRIAHLEATGATGAQITDALGKFTALQARVAALDADIARTAETYKGTLDAINVRLAKIEAALPPNLAERLETLAPKTDLAASDTRIARLETMNAGDTLHRAAAVLALADLAQAADAGRPFRVELDALAAAAPHDPAVAAMMPYAAAGVPTLAAVRARFPVAARNAIDVMRSTQPADVFSRLWSNIEGLISIRRVGDVSGTTPDARLARAQVKLDAGDLAGAVAEVSAIGAPSAIALAPWLKEARARLLIDQMIAVLDARVVRAIAATRPAPDGQHGADGTQ